AQYFSPGYALHLLQFGHQMRFVMQTASGIYDEDIGVARFCGLERIKEHCRRISSLFLLNQLHTRALGPNRELIRSGSAKSVRRADQDFIALGFDPLCEFADSRGFAR